jgi:regulator of replication initiation timing
MITQTDDLKREIARLQDAKRRALQVADERAKEVTKLRLENEQLRAQLEELRS